MKLLKKILIIFAIFFAFSTVLGFLRTCKKEEEAPATVSKEIITVNLLEYGYNYLDTNTYVGITDGAELRFYNEGEARGTILTSDGGTLTIKNLTIYDKTSDAGAGIYESYLRFGGKLYFENCVFENSICLTTDAEAEFVNCKFVSGQSRYYSCWVADGSASFENCTFVWYRGLKINEFDETYKIDKEGDIEDVVTVSVESCVFQTSEKPGVSLGGFMSADNTTVSIKNSVFKGCEVYETGGAEITLIEDGNIVE